MGRQKPGKTVDIIWDGMGYMGYFGGYSTGVWDVWYINNISLQVKDLVKLGLLILMIRTFYYLIGAYFYLDLVGGIVFQPGSISFLIGSCQDFDGSELYHEVTSGDL